MPLSITLTPPQGDDPMWHMSVPLGLLTSRGLLEKVKEYLQYGLSRGHGRVSLTETAESLNVAFGPQYDQAHWGYIDTFLGWLDAPCTATA